MRNNVTSECKVGGGTYLTSTRRLGFTLIELLAVVVILGVLAMIAIPTITNVMNKAKEKTFESQARMLIGAARNASIENPSKICYALSELSNYVNKDISGYSGSVLLDKENKVNKIWLSKEPYIINGSIEEEIEVIELEQYQEASETCEDIEILACSEDPTSYTLVINPEGGIHDGHEANEGYELTKNGTKTITEPTKFGYVFDGWEIVTGTPGSFVDELFVMGEENVVIRAKWLQLYTYTGTSTLIDDGDGNWRIKFLSSGTLTFFKDTYIDAFLVGGGASSSHFTNSGDKNGAGGCGYHTTINGLVITSETEFSIVIGSGGTLPTTVHQGNGGGLSSAFSFSASGGNPPLANGWETGISGVGGPTCFEFDESSGSQYSHVSTVVNNTGNGGSVFSSGSSGIVIIRNHR